MSKKITGYAGIIFCISLICCSFFIGGNVNYKKAKAETVNLLVNPGAETGDLTGWVDSSAEKCWMLGYEGSIKGWSHPAAKSGKYYFMTGWPSESNSNRYLYQDVNISSYVGAKLTFEGYLGGYGHDDKGGIKLDILDQTGNVLDSKSTEMYAVSWGDWSKHVEVSADVPSGAYTARVYLIGALHEGDEADAYFDDLSLTASGEAAKAIKLGQVKKLKLTNKKGKHIYVSFKAVSGAEGYQVEYAVKKSMKGAKSATATVTKGYFLDAKGKKIAFKKGKTYYVLVRAYAKDASGKTVYGKWSSKKKVKIKK